MKFKIDDPVAYRDLVNPAKSWKKIADKKSDAVLFVSKTHLHLKGYSGKRSKPDFYYSYRTKEALDAAAKKYFELVRASAAEKAKRLATRKAENSGPLPVKVGDIFLNSWGWEQTNTDFYEVVAVRGRMVDLRPIAHETKPREGCSPMAGYATALPGQFTGPVFSKKVTVHTGSALISMGHGHCGLWNGLPAYESWYA